MRAIRYLKRSLVDHLLYGPLPVPNLLLNGCSDAVVLRTCVEVAHWAAAVFKDSPVLVSNSFRLVEQHLADRASGEMQSGHEYTLRMPTLDGNNLLPYTSGGWDNIPSRIIDCSAKREKEVVEMIAEEAREKLAIDLDEHPIVDRWPSTIGLRPGEGGPEVFPSDRQQPRWEAG
jgi:hypothetical protein